MVFETCGYSITSIFCGVIVLLFIIFILRKIPKISPGAYSFQRPFFRGLYTVANLRCKTDWVSL